MTTDEIGDYGMYSHCSQNQWRPTLAEAQKLLVRKIWDKKKELEEQIDELDEKMADLLDEMYPE
jgi:septal ring factor EnvC (AmiA/AmiB activator)